MPDSRDFVPVQIRIPRLEKNAIKKIALDMDTDLSKLIRKLIRKKIEETSHQKSLF